MARLDILEGLAVDVAPHAIDARNQVGRGVATYVAFARADDTVAARLEPGDPMEQS